MSPARALVPVTGYGQVSVYAKACVRSVAIGIIGFAGAVSATGKPWTIADIVDVRQIQSVAVSSSEGEAAYVLREPSVAADRVKYELCEVELSGAGHPNCLLEARYIKDVTQRSGAKRWTILADIGNGVQLYDVGDSGTVFPVAVSSSTAMVGAYGGVIPTVQGPRRAGVWSYQWSPDGSELWYSTLKLRTPVQVRAFDEDGVEYDDQKDVAFSTLRRPAGEFVGFELHVQGANGKGSHVVAFVPADQFLEEANLRRDLASALWMRDSRHIVYTTDTLAPSGRIAISRWYVDAKTGVKRALPLNSPWWVMAVPAADSGRYYEVKQFRGADHLWEYSDTGTKTKDLGGVPYSMVGMMKSFPGGTWIDSGTGRQILSALYHHHIGLVSLPQSRAGRAWAKVKDNLNPCDFTDDLRIGVCVRQSQTLAPELVVLNGRTGAMRTVARPNARYARITPLNVKLEHWTNKYGQKSDGYVIYPRHYSAERKYPLIVVTHVDGAINTFADQGMIQGEIPVQALAEGGYLVVEANTPWTSLAQGTPWQFRHVRTTETAVRTREMRVIKGPVASMEAVVVSLVRAGVVDPAKTGIAGYSDGAALSLFTMTQSKLFRVASIDDGASGPTADEYWEDGIVSAQYGYRSLYGGSAYSSNPDVIRAYRKFSPDFRASSFAGPLLEQPAAGSATTALARLVFLREAGIPYDLVFYPNESHLFWDPRASAASMQRTLDWFNYWLLGKRSADPSKGKEYRRWDKMRMLYGKQCRRCLFGLGPWTVAGEGGRWPNG